MKPLSQDERRIFADLIARDRCEKEAEEEQRNQQRLRDEAYLASQKNDEVSLRNLQYAEDERDQQFVPGERGKRRTVTLSEEDKMPQVNLIDQRIAAIQSRLQEIEAVTVAKPAPEEVVQKVTLSAVYEAILLRIYRWATR